MSVMRVETWKIFLVGCLVTVINVIICISYTRNYYQRKARHVEDMPEMEVDIQYIEPTTRSTVTMKQIKTTLQTTKAVVTSTFWPTTTPETPYVLPVFKCEKNLIGKLRIDKGRAELTYWNLTGAVNSLPAMDIKNLGMYSSFALHEVIPETSQTNTNDTCQYQRVALIIPFRDREHHLKILLGHLLPILQRQKVRYTVFVAEQSGNNTYNKGRLMNTAFEFAAAYGRNIGQNFDCFIFHDVDMLVEHDTTLYRCSPGQTVDHFGTTIDKYGYRRMCCYVTVGGVVAFKEREFRLVNGYPNSYWGWGGEDDDMDLRLSHHKINITRPAAPLGRYSMIKHDRDAKNPVNPRRKRHLKFAKKRFKSDGLSSLNTKILELQKYPLFIKVLIDVDPLR